MGVQSRSGTRPIELGLRDDPSAVVRALLDRSFGLIGECVSACDDSDVLAADVQECQTTIAVGASAADVEAVCVACLDTCREFLAGSNATDNERRQDFHDLIGLAQTAIETISGEKTVAGSDLSQSVAQFDALLELEDLAQLKTQLTSSLANFRAASEAHRQAFQHTIDGYQERITVLEANLVRNEREATIDALTGLINRGAFDRTVQGLVDMSGARFSLALLDVDRLKKINDVHGHLSGDRALINIAQNLKTATRDTDLICRYGPDEFAVLMRDCPLRHSEARIYNAVSTITHNRLIADDGRAVMFTLSGGVAELSPGDSMQDVAKRAEEALREAKDNGRNRIVARAVRPRMGVRFIN